VSDDGGDSSSRTEDDGAPGEATDEDSPRGTVDEDPPRGTVDEDPPRGTVDEDPRRETEAGDSRSETAEDGPASTSEDSDSSGFLGNIKNARSQLGDAREAFSNARGGGKLPTDEEGRVRLVCRRYDERRLVPLDDRGRPSCFEAGNEDCEGCLEDVRDGSAETW